MDKGVRQGEFEKAFYREMNIIRDQLLTIPVPPAATKRSFSKLGRLKIGVPPFCTGLTANVIEIGKPEIRLLQTQLRNL